MDNPTLPPTADAQTPAATWPCTLVREVERARSEEAQRLANEFAAYSMEWETN